MVNLKTVGKRLFALTTNWSLKGVNLMRRNFNISLLFALKAQVQKAVKTAMDGNFRNFGKVSRDGLT